MSTETRNAVIESATLMNDDHGCLSAWLHLDYGGSGQGFGGYALYLPKSYKHHAGQGPAAGHFIYRCLEIAGVTEWSKLAGRTIRVRADWGKVHAIGHIVKEDWFDPSADFEAMQNTRATPPRAEVDVELASRAIDNAILLASVYDGVAIDGNKVIADLAALRRALSRATGGA